ncbi:MAG: hypothetical protein K8I30_08650, partial [Anaerolineae bacterium]|nr:hypothetical protein [Anaerolineae bacterium]
YPHFYVTLKADDDSTRPGALHLPFTPFTPVASVTVLASDETCATPLTFATSDNVVTAWRGFRNVRFYFMGDGR